MEKKNTKQTSIKEFDEYDMPLAMFTPSIINGQVTGAVLKFNRMVLDALKVNSTIALIRDSLGYSIYNPAEIDAQVKTLKEIDENNSIRLLKSEVDILLGNDKRGYGKEFFLKCTPIKNKNYENSVYFPLS